jgi:hypothetical protein
MTTPKGAIARRLDAACDGTTSAPTYDHMSLNDTPHPPTTMTPLLNERRVTLSSCASIASIFKQPADGGALGGSEQLAYKNEPSVAG